MGPRPSKFASLISQIPLTEARKHVRLKALDYFANIAESVTTNCITSLLAYRHLGTALGLLGRPSRYR